MRPETPTLFPADRETLLAQRRDAVRLAMRSGRQDVTGYQLAWAIRLNERIVRQAELPA